MEQRCALLFFPHNSDFIQRWQIASRPTAHMPAAMPTYYPLIPPPRSDPAATRATQQLRARRAARATP